MATKAVNCWYPSVYSLHTLTITILAVYLDIKGKASIDEVLKMYFYVFKYGRFGIKDTKTVREIVYDIRNTMVSIVGHFQMPALGNSWMTGCEFSKIVRMEYRLESRLENCRYFFNNSRYDVTFYPKLTGPNFDRALSMIVPCGYFLDDVLDAVKSYVRDEDVLSNLLEVSVDRISKIK